MKKRMISILTALCLCLGLAACGTTPAAPEATPEPAQPDTQGNAVRKHTDRARKHGVRCGKYRTQALRQGDGLYAQPRRSCR